MSIHYDAIHGFTYNVNGVPKKTFENILKADTNDQKLSKNSKIWKEKD